MRQAIQSAIYAKAFSNGTPFGENVVTEEEEQAEKCENDGAVM